MFRGRYQHTIDPKGRLSVPARFRDALAQYGESLVVVPNEHSLEVHPLEEWQRIEEKVNSQSMFSPDVRKLSRLYISRARDITLDAGGSCVDGFARYTTSATKDVADDGLVPLSGGRAAVTLEGQSVTTFVSD